MKTDDELIAELKRAAEGLLFMSESDYPFETVCWQELPGISAEFLRSQAGVADDALVETASVDDFFRVAVSDQSQMSQASRETAVKYRQLVKIIKENLEDPKVYRVGSVNIAVYIVGRNETGNWLGLSTRVVET
jgi:hypothetical protein